MSGGEAAASTRPLRSVVKTFAVIDALIERGEASAAELAETVDETRRLHDRMPRPMLSPYQLQAFPHEYVVHLAIEPLFK